MNFKLSSRVTNIPLRHKDCGFTNYKTSEENIKQYNSCFNWDGKKSIILTGKTGTGKTHLAIAMLRNYPMVELPEEIANEEKIRLEKDIENKRVRYFSDGSLVPSDHSQKILDSGIWKYRPANCLFVSIVEMFVEINNAAMNDGSKMYLLQKYSSPKFDCICFDDLGAEKLTDAKRENLYYIIDARYRNILPTIVTSNFTINEISEVEPRIASRFAEMGQILQFNGKDFRKGA